jgi:hypothetical protein
MMEDSSMSIDLPLLAPGYAGPTLRELSEGSGEMHNLMVDKLKRGLQKPPIMTNPQYAEEMSGAVDMNLSGMINQDVMLEGVLKPSQYSKDTNAQAFRRLWLEVLDQHPTNEELMIFEYSGITFDPRLGTIVKDNPGNIYSEQSSSVNSLMMKSYASFTKDQISTPDHRGGPKTVSSEVLARLKSAIFLAKTGSALISGVKLALAGLEGYPGVNLVLMSLNILGSMLDSGVNAGRIFLYVERMIRAASGAASHLNAPVAPSGF